MKTSIKIALLLYCFSFQLVQSQNKKLDSLLKVYDSQPEDIEKFKTLDKMFKASKSGDPNVSLKYAREQLSLSKRIDYKTGEGIAFYNLGNYYRSSGFPDSSRYYYKKALPIFKSTNKKKRLWDTYMKWAKVEQLQGDFDKAIDMYDEAINIAKEFGNGVRISDGLQNKSTVYMDKGSYKLALEELLKASRIVDTIPGESIRKAIILVGIGRSEFLRENYEASLPYHNQGLNIFIEENNESWKGITYIEIGLSYYYLKDYDNAIKHFTKSLEISKKKNDDFMLAISQSNIGMVLTKQNEHDKALTYLYKGLELNKKIGSLNNLAINYNEVGNALIGKKNIKEAINNYSIAIKIADSINALNESKEGYGWRSLAYEQYGDYKKALADQKKFKILNDSIFNTSKSQQIEELRTIYEIEKKEQQIVLQGNEIDLLNQKAKIGNQQRMLLGLGLLLSLIGLYALRQKMKRNKLLKEKVDAELAYKKKELTTHALHLAKKNEVLDGLKQIAQELKTAQSGEKGYQQLIRTIDFDLQDDNNWENFAKYFEEVHKDFNGNVKQKYPEITSNELRLLSLLKMNLSSKEIANILNISQDGIKKARYRLRKKLNITSEESLQDLVISL